MATYYVTTTGAGAHNGSNEANAFTLEEACDAVAANDVIYVKANANYIVEYVTGGAKNCVMYGVANGTRNTPIRWIGYHTVITDGGVVTLDAQDTLNHALDNNDKIWHFFENFQFVNGALHTVLDPGDNVYFKNSSFEGAGDRGVSESGAAFGTYVHCRFTGNTEEGYYSLTANNRFHACLFHTNGKSGCINVGNDTVYSDCLFYNNGTSSVPRAVHGYSTCGVTAINCTFDGENDAAAAGLYIDNDATNNIALAINCIFYDFNAGVQAVAVSTVCRFVGCLFFSNTADTTNIIPAFTTGDNVGDDGCVAAAPGFTNEGADDYTLAGGSAAKGSAYDAKFTVDFWASFDAANNPPVP